MNAKQRKVARKHRKKKQRLRERRKAAAAAGLPGGSVRPVTARR
jgi:hypothetical protein